MQSDALCQLADRQYTDIEILLVGTLQPGEDIRVGIPLPGVRDDVGIEENAQSSIARPRSRGRSILKSSTFGPDGSLVDADEVVISCRFKSYPQASDCRRSPPGVDQDDHISEQNYRLKIITIKTIYNFKYCQRQNYETNPISANTLIRLDDSP